MPDPDISANKVSDHITVLKVIAQYSADSLVCQEAEMPIMPRGQPSLTKGLHKLYIYL